MADFSPYCLRIREDDKNRGCVVLNLETSKDFKLDINVPPFLRTAGKVAESSVTALLPSFDSFANLEI